jgi:hypothetical protein
MNTSEYAMYAHAQLLRNYLQQRPSNEGKLYSSVNGGGTSYLLHDADLGLI